MAWCRIAEKLLYDMNQCWSNSLAHIYSTWGRWVNQVFPPYFNFLQTVSIDRPYPGWKLILWFNSLRPRDAYMRQSITIIGSDYGLSPGRRQAIIWTNAGIMLIGPLGTNFSEILIEIYTFSFRKMHLKMSSGKWRPSCLGFNVLITLVWKMDH